jgi:hypothetical protein
MCIATGCNPSFTGGTHLAKRAFPLFIQSSSSGQRLADFRLLPSDKSTSTHFVRCVSFISCRSPPIRTSLNGRLRFLSIQLQGPNGYRTSVFLLAISHHRIATALRDSFISCGSLPVRTPLSGAFPLFIQNCHNFWCNRDIINRIKTQSIL